MTLLEKLTKAIDKALNEALKEKIKYSNNPNSPYFFPFAERKQFLLTPENSICIDGDPEYEEKKEKKIVNNGKGRPATTSKLSNLYPIRANESKKVEQYIRAYVNTMLNKSDKIYYADNVEDMNKLRNIFIVAIYDFMKNNKEDEFDWVDGDKYFSKLYNVDDLGSFIEDLRTNYRQLRKSQYFPMKIQLNEPIKLKSKRGRKPKQGLSAKQEQQADWYINMYGKGTLLEDLDDKTIEDIRKYSLHRNGVAYFVCRPIPGGKSDPNVPYIVYKGTNDAEIKDSKLHNAIRSTYCKQCLEEYGCYADYYYVSPIMIDKFLRKEEE